MFEFRTVDYLIGTDVRRVSRKWMDPKDPVDVKSVKARASFSISRGVNTVLTFVSREK